MGEKLQENPQFAQNMAKI